MNVGSIELKDIHNVLINTNHKKTPVCDDNERKYRTYKTNVHFVAAHGSFHV